MLDDAIHERVMWMKSQASSRDARMELMRRVRSGDLEMVDPAAFSDLFPKPVVANFITNAAEDFANSVAPLPALNCAAGAMRTDKDKHRGSKKNKGGDSYWRKSRLERNMFQAADQYDTYGFTVFYVEPDFKEKSPHIFVEDGVGAYFTKNRHGRTTHYVKCWNEKRGDLRAMFPEITALAPSTRTIGSDDETIEVVRYCDDEQVVLYASHDRTRTTLAQYKNKIGLCPAAVAERHSLDSETRGRYDDAVWPQLARNRMRMYLIEATEKAVHAPIQVGFDVQELPVGPDAIIQSETPIHRVGIDVPQAAFAVEAQMQDETRTATKHPSARDGNAPGQVVTGRGVEALMGAFDGQIKAAQIMLGEALSEATSLAFRVDEVYFGTTPREIQGTLSGESYVETWTPVRDIAGNYTCSVDYGFAAGLGAGQAVVLMLQLLGAGLLSNATVQRNMPFAVDVDMESRHIQAEGLQKSLLQGFEGLASALPQMAAQGMDISVPLQQLARVIQLRSKGKSLEDAALEAFAPLEPETTGVEETGPAGQAGPSGAPSGPGGQDQGPPDLMNLMAGMRNGQVITGSNIQRRTPV